MVDQIGGGGGALAREAILAAMKAQAEKREQIRASALSGAEQGRQAQDPAAESVGDFADQLKGGLKSVDEGIKRVDDLPRALLEGEVQDLHEVAAQVKKAEFNFRFALEIRNKLIDAYREVMRMNV